MGSGAYACSTRSALHSLRCIQARAGTVWGQIALVSLRWATRCICVIEDATHLGVFFGVAFSKQHGPIQVLKTIGPAHLHLRERTIWGCTASSNNGFRSCKSLWRRWTMFEVWLVWLTTHCYPGLFNNKLWSQYIAQYIILFNVILFIVKQKRYCTFIYCKGIYNILAIYCKPV